MKEAFAAFTIFLFSVIAYSQDSLVISEFMAGNSSILQDEDGDFSDWIEIYNPDTFKVGLWGWFLTDEKTNFAKWSFPKDTIGPKEYLVVFASGKDRKIVKNKLHTNFKLSTTGEFLALIKPGALEYTTAFDTAFPEQYADISYGEYNGRNIYFSNPSPGTLNSFGEYIPSPGFSIQHGYYYDPFEIELYSVLDHVEIYYTLDASDPEKTEGIKYTNPVQITTTTVIRAITVRDGVDSSKSVSQSYIFPEDVINQSNTQPGYPGTWLSPIHGTNDYNEISSNYNMKEECVNRSDVKPVIVESLKSLPVISIVTDIDNLFSKSMHPDSGGIYMYNGEPDGPTRDLKYHLGRGWTRPASVEYFDPGTKDTLVDFQANCCIRIHGGASRTRSKTEKHSFKIGFKSEYGPAKLQNQVFGKGSPKQYDWLILRGGFAPRLGLQIYDPWAKSAMRDMGQYAANSKFVHLYLNGFYWGMYNLSEQMDENSVSDNLGGKSSDYDVIKDYYEVEAGDTLAWSKLVAMAGNNIKSPENYQRLLGNNADGTPNPAYEKLLNVENLIDYITMNMYGGTGDWDNHNWAAARRKTDSEGFHFLVWDAEGVLRGVNDSRIILYGEHNRPTGIFSDLLQNDAFRNHLISRINKHFFEDGALTPKPSLNRYEMWLNSIDTALIADQARWVWSNTDIWNKNYHSFRLSYFPRRTEIVFKQLVAAGLYPEIKAPVFNTTNAIIPDDFELKLSSPSGGEIRYTLDGTDPGHFSLTSSKSILIYDNNSIPLTNDTLLIYARVKKDSLWSALVTKQFIVGEEVSIFTDNLGDNNGYLHNYPNPMRDFTTIRYSLSKSSDISISIFNLMGEQMETLVNGTIPAGEQDVTWNPGNIAPGTYICIFDNRSDMKRNRITIIKE